MDPLLRPLPQDIGAEASVLGAILIDKEAIYRVMKILSADDFYREAHQKIFSAILGLRGEGKEIDSITLSDELRKRRQLEEIGGSSYIATLLDSTPSAANVKYHAKIVKKKAVLRSLIGAATRMIHLSYEEGGELDSILGESQRLFHEILAQSGDKGGATKLEIGPEALREYFSLRETPFQELNELIGGFSGGELVVIGGRPGMGKTSLVLGFLQYTAIEEQRPVIYFGAGITKQIIYSRLLCSICGIDFKDFKRGRITSNQTKELMEAHKKINEAPIYLLAAKGDLNAVRLVSQAEAQMKEFGDLGLIIAENLQQLTWPGTFQNRKQETDVILGALKSLTVGTNTPVILSSQVGRQVDQREDKRPLISDLKETGGIEEIADKVFLLFREGFYTEPDSNSPEKGEKGEIIIAKGGPRKTLFLNFYGGCLSWKEGMLKN